MPGTNHTSVRLIHFNVIHGKSERRRPYYPEVVTCRMTGKGSKFVSKRFGNVDSLEVVGCADSVCEAEAGCDEAALCVG